jgi:hypothetical protein
MVVTLALLVGFVWHLAAHRIYQVDEAQNLFMTRTLATHQAGTYFTNALLWMVGPLGWLARSATDSSNLFFAARMVFLGVFFLNVTLLALVTGVRLRSRQGILVLLGAATLAPLWDYGFEIRHDNLILTGLLLLWWLGRIHPRGRRSYAAMGFLAVVLLFVAFKSFAYVLPLCMAFLLLPPPGHGEGRIRLFLAWMVGACLGVVLVALVYGVTGTWPIFVAGLGGGLGISEGSSGFSSWVALGRLPAQTPLLLGLVMGALITAGRSMYVDGKTAWTWDGLVPEALLFLGALGILLINPTPFPYNLVNLVPFAFLLGFRFLEPILADLDQGSRAMALAVGAICFTHAVPFVTATWRHLDWTNDRQELLMRTAEALTDPASDPVYDAIGMVPTRPGVGFHWYLHSLNMKSFAEGRVPSVPQMLSTRPAAVLITSYRTDWLAAADHQFIQDRYVPLADDFWVLGKVLPMGGGKYEVVHAGRYVVLGRKQDLISNLSAGTLNAQPLVGTPLTLAVGPQQITCPPDTQPIVAWLGPRLDRLPVIVAGDHRHLFVNWY